MAALRLLLSMSVDKSLLPRRPQLPPQREQGLCGDPSSSCASAVVWSLGAQAQGGLPEEQSDLDSLTQAGQRSPSPHPQGVKGRLVRGRELLLETRDE